MRRSAGRLGRWFSACGAVATIVLAQAAPARAGDRTSAPAQAPLDAISALNAQRAYHGLPADIVEEPGWSRGCELHMAYSARNRVLEHAEDPRLPGYTELGDEAGRGSVLSSGSRGFTPRANPWEAAPIHYMQVMAPALSVTGLYSGPNGACLRTFAGYRRSFEQDQLFVLPGDRTVAPYEETASERPFVPGDLVGLPQGTRTGPRWCRCSATRTTAWWPRCRAPRPARR